MVKNPPAIRKTWVLSLGWEDALEKGKATRSSLNWSVSFLCIRGKGIDFDYYNVEWLALETNQDVSVILEVAPKYCILDSFIDYEGHSISSMGFCLQ